ncbi:MAG: hypothetical protein NZ533_09605 [Casimicrobiaceae bacterium]|nr:hypothetical protein [Casimicrobiaceae bacterium]MCX8097702.1 hypothetical protein [Casimicrobiaceae bacterium]
MKAFEAADGKLTTYTEEERRWVEQTVRIARARALLDVFEIRALAELNRDRKALRERAYERYLAEPLQYNEPSRADVRVIVIHSTPFDEAVKKIQAVREALGRGEPFEQVAEQYTQARDAQGRPRIEQTVSAAEAENEIAEWMFKKAKPGDVFGPVVSSGHFSMIQLLRVHPPRKIPFDHIADRIADQIRREAARGARLKAADALLPEPVEWLISPSELP